MGSPTGDYMKQIPISFFFPYSFIIIQSLSSLLINFILIATPEKKKNKEISQSQLEICRTFSTGSAKDLTWEI